jgi:anti-sigma factor RsiW
MSTVERTNEALHEELSAYMDGELDADRARFLQQRMRHDADLRARWERWQLLSSSMRRQAQPLPPDFADRVASALDADAVHAVPVRNRALRWAGGAALAASLSVAGVFVFDATHQPQATAPQVAATPTGPPAISPIQRTAIALPEPRIVLPIPVHDGVVTAFRSPLRPAVLRQQRQAPEFSPFPQPYAIDPELEAYLQRQKSGANRDVFTRDGVNLPDTGDSAVRTVAWPQDGQH